MPVRPHTITVPPASMDEAACACADAVALGELVIVPTDTVYGLACDPLNLDAVLRIYQAKGRPRGLALPVLVASGEDAARLMEGAPSAAAKLLFDRFWPGALTVVVPCADELRGAVTGGRDTVGLRLPASEIARAVIAACGGALATTSANVTAGPPACEVAELSAKLLTQVAVVVDAGRCEGEVASTVVDLSVSPPRILREGPISADDLRQVLSDLA